MRMCTEYEDMISAFIDGALTEGDRAALMEHMASCPACQEYFDQQIALTRNRSIRRRTLCRT